jgi:N-acetylglucosaminyldiphosphoundecaprenol N-acetyl-beta-D-mannosaminyltransferase
VHCVLGLPFDAISKSEAIRHIDSASSSRRCFLSTPNLNFLIASRRNAQFRDSVIRSDLSVADGMPLVWIASLLGVPIRERVSGSDLFEAFTRREGRALKVFFFGGPDGVAQDACRRLNAMTGAMRCVGFASPGFGTVEQLSRPEMIERINRSGADFLVVALGAVKGQAWIEHNRDALNAPVISHLGAVVNFVAGRLARAPVLVRRLGLEWLWRIKEEPALWRRYASDASALLRLMFTRVLPGLICRACGVLGRKGAPAGMRVDAGDGTVRLILSGSWSKAELPLLQETLQLITAEPVDIDMDVAGLEQVDEAFIGSLMLLYGHQSKSGRAFRIFDPGPGLRRAFRLRCADFLLEGRDRVR